MIMGQAATKAGRAIANNASSSASVTAAAAAHHRRHEAIELATVIGQGKIKAPTSSSQPTTDSDDDAALALSAVAARHQRHRDEIAAEMFAAASGRTNTATTTNNNVEVMPEMPPELLKFLTDTGPLHKTVDKSATSSRIYDVLEKGGTKVRDEHAKAANARVRRRMPLVKKSSSQQQKLDGDTGSRHDEVFIRGGRIEENVDDDDIEDDGTTVTRTTNFSTIDRSSSAYRGLSVTREDYFRILSNNNNNNNLGAMLLSKGAVVDSPEWKAAVELEYKKMTSTNNATTTIATNDTTNEEDDDKDDDKKKTKSSNNSSMTFDELRDIKLFEDSLHYIGVPVLMKDNDGDIIGVWSHKVTDMKHSSGLKVVTEGSIEFVMKNE